MRTLDVRVLGGLRVEVGGHEVHRFRSVNVQALLVHLVLRRDETLRREAVATLLWPQADEPTARQNLRQTLRRLRLVLDGEDGDGPSRLDTTRTTVRLSPDVELSVDVDVFRAAVDAGKLADAVSVYRGDLVPGLDCRSPAYDRWLDAERSALRREAVEALGTLGSGALERGDHAAALAMADRQLALAPAHEPAHRLRMRALAQAGDRAGALQQFEACRRVLTDDLGVEPDAETRAVAERLRAGSASAPEDRGAGGSDAPEPFVGRGEEFARLVAASSTARRVGTLRVTLVTGQAGIGKTRLAERFLTHAATDGADILRGRASAGGTAVPFEVIVDLLRPRVHRENAPADLLDDLWLSQLARLLPELHERYPDLAPAVQDEATGLGHLRESIARLVDALAQERPVVLLVDDLQFVDESSLDVLVHAIRRWARLDAPIHLVVTSRTEGLADPRIASWLVDVERSVAVEHVELGPFSTSETALMVSAVGGDRQRDGFEGADLVLWLHGNTGGHPLLVAESLRVLGRSATARASLTADDGIASGDPEASRGAVVTALRRVVDAWLVDLSAAAERVLTAASVLGRSASDAILRQVTGLDADDVATAIDALVRAGVLTTTEVDAYGGTAHEFGHDLVVDVVRDRAGPARRRLLHERCLDAMTRAGAPPAEALPHAVASARWDEAVRLGLEAGQHALDLLALTVANRHLTTARDLVRRHGWPTDLAPSDRERLLTGIARTHDLLGNTGEAEAAYRELVAYARSADELAMEARALCGLGDLAIFAGEPHEVATALLERALTVAREAGSPREMAAAELRLASAAFLVANDGRLAREHAARAHGHAVEADDQRALARHATLVGTLAIIEGDWNAALVDFRRGRDAWRLLGDRVLVGDAARSLGYAELMTGHPRAGEATVLEELEFARRIDNHWGIVECEWKLGHTWLELGRYGDALASARDAVREREVPLDRMLVELGHAVATHVHRTVYDHDAARGYLETVVQIRGLRREGASTVMVHDDWAESELAIMAAVEGDWRGAARHARRRLVLRQGATGLSMAMDHWVLTEALLRAGDDGAARADVDQLRGAAEGNRRFQLVLRRCDAVLAAWDDDGWTAATHLEEALRLAREIGLPGQEWTTLTALAAVQDRLGETGRADASRVAAREIVEDLAAGIDDDEIRRGFLAGPPVSRLLDTTDGT